MKLREKVSAVAIASVVVVGMTFSSFATGTNTALWGAFQKDNTHNGVIETETYTGGNISGHISKKDLERAAWSGIDSAPVIGTEGTGKTYAYCLYSGTSTTKLAKVDCENPDNKVWGDDGNGITVTNSSSFQLSTPALVGNSLYFGTTGFGQMASNADLADGSTSGWEKSTNNTTISAEGGYVKVSGNGTASLAQTITLGQGKGNRVTSAIKLIDGSSATLKVYSNEDEIATKEISGTDWNYLNQNVSSFTIGGNYEIKFELTINGSAYIDYCSVYEEGLQIKKIPDVTSDTPTIETLTSTELGGQIDTPIVVDGNYLYFGTYTGGKSYYQLNLTNNTLKTFTPSSDNFYWAGALTNTNGYVYFGSDNSKIYGRKISNFDAEGITPIDLTTYASDAGQVRSTLMSKDGYMYFTTKGGYLWCFKIESNGNLTHKWHEKLPAASTSTPVISDNDRLYVGYYSGFNAGGVKGFKLADNKDNAPTAIGSITNKGPVQSSVVVYSESTTDYIYFTTNSSTGAGYCYSNTGSSFTNKWETASDTYALQGMASGNGYLVFGNDYSVIEVIKK